MPLRDRSEGNLTTIELTTPGEWVKVKTKLGRGDQLRIQRALMKHFGLKGKLGELRDAPELTAENIDASELDVGEAVEILEFIALEVGVVSWCFDVPVTPQSLRELDPDDRKLIDDRLSEMYAERKDDERQDSLPGGPPTS